MIKRPYIHLLEYSEEKSPDALFGIENLRIGYDCLWTDAEVIKRHNPIMQLPDTMENFKHQPLRLIWIELAEINFEWNVFSDKWRRNTMVLASDDDIAAHEEIAHELEKRGIALLMAGKDTSSSLLSVLRSLHSLKLKSILVEGSGQSLKLFSESGLVDEVVSLTD